jgi:putative Mn2+ efflux pump MntP
MLALLLVAVSLGLSNFAAAIAIGVSGVDARTRLRVAIVFGLAANYRHGRGHGRRAE